MGRVNKKQRQVQQEREQILRVMAEAGDADLVVMDIAARTGIASMAVAGHLRQMLGEVPPLVHVAGYRKTPSIGRDGTKRAAYKLGPEPEQQYQRHPLDLITMRWGSAA